MLCSSQSGSQLSVALTSISGWTKRLVESLSMHPQCQHISGFTLHNPLVVEQRPSTTGKFQTMANSAAQRGILCHLSPNQETQQGLHTMNFIFHWFKSNKVITHLSGSQCYFENTIADKCRGNKNIVKQFLMLPRGLKHAARRPQTSLNSLQEAANTYLVLITARGLVESPVFVTLKELKVFSVKAR